MKKRGKKLESRAMHRVYDFLILKSESVESFKI